MDDDLDYSTPHRDPGQQISNSLPVQHFVPEQTIQCYLDALLQEAAAELALAETQVEPAELPEPAVSAPTEETLAVETALTAAPSIAPLSFAEPPVAIPPATQPSWRNEPFEALLFNVGGLTLAVPLVSL